MKKLNFHQKLRQQRHARYSQKRNQLSRIKRALRRSHRLPAFDKSGRWINVYRDGKFSLTRVLNQPRPVPAILSFENNYEETAQFLRDLRVGLTASFSTNRHSRRRNEKSVPVFNRYWDFTLINRISVPVALIVASEYDRLRKCGGWRPYAIDFENWRPEVRVMLDSIGFLSLCGVHHQAGAIVGGAGWKVLRFESGLKADGERVEELLKELGVDTVFGDPRLYEAMIEALANTRHHAYPEGHSFSEPHFPGWWMTGFVDEKSMLITVYDKGISIPAALADPRNAWEHHAGWEKLMARLLRRDVSISDTSADGAAIAAAMKVGRSSTGHEFRGRGLKTFEDALDAFPRGRLTIRSRAGEYRKDSGSKGRYTTRPTPIDGTLIIWRVART
ncbi:hypothetical protein [Bradyrhizobium sp. 18]|uniref:hypothetical protein n=1 Tax=Bradyrhizobium sp. 18 TaxID=2782657 RepID=UPI001FF8DD99|nr:hypothetical protein [Bradyrhizobium sp. 18]MCK1507193.1 hypothetical protein [Bradyrhizobium sp. 18]